MTDRYQPHLDLRPQLRFASQSEADDLIRFKLRACAVSTRMKEKAA